MNNPFAAKSIFVWNVPAIEGGDPLKFAAAMKAAGFQHVIIKGGDGAVPVGASAPSLYKPSLLAYPLWMRKPNLSLDLVAALHVYGITASAYLFCYGVDPDGEGRNAALMADAFNLDGVVLDVEGQFEALYAPKYDTKIGVGNAGKLIGTYLRTSQSRTPLALCSWAEFYSPKGVRWHNDDMARFFMAQDIVVAGMPMCYWARYGSNGNPVDPLPQDATTLLTHSLAQWGKITSKPIIPVGRAYTGDGGFATVDAAQAFDIAVRAAYCPGESWWGADWAYTKAQKPIPGLWGALTNMQPFGSPAPQPKPVTPVTVEIPGEPASTVPFAVDLTVDALNADGSVSGTWKAVQA